MFDQAKWRVLGIVLASGIAYLALINYRDLLPAPLRDMVAWEMRLNPFIEAVGSWVRKASTAAPDAEPTRLRLCVNADVPVYGNMQDRAAKNLQWLRAHKEEYSRAMDEGDDRWEREFKGLFDSVDLADPKFSEGFRWTFSVGHTAGCLEYEKQLATQAASAPDDALFGSCINTDLGVQMREAVKELPDFELKQRQNVGDPAFAGGAILGGQRGHVDGCLLADALKRSGY